MITAFDMTQQKTPNRTPRTTARFTCQHCHGTFVNESRYMQHQCQQMKRLEEIKTPLGQAAYVYYAQWMRSNNRMPPPQSTFLTSKYFRTFINFAVHVQKINMPRAEKFIWLMVERKIQPSIWTSTDVYSIFLEYLDRVATPLEQANLSIQTLSTIAANNDVDISKVFHYITISQIIDMLVKRHLSPWLLLCSTAFKQLVKSSASPEQRIILETLIRAEYWGQQLQIFHAEHEIIKGYAEELGI